METVEVVIKIPKERLNEIIKVANTMFGSTMLNDIEDAILDGRILPKGHGRLVDADEMVKILRKSEYYQEKRGDFYGADVTSRVKNFIEDTETVIEADKTESEETDADSN
jgi:hypothetical protein